MKKLFVKIISLITATVISLGLFSGCDLVTTDVERDMNQVIATVSIPNSGLKDTIYKRELVSQYNSEGYLYVAYYGYTESQAYNLILNNLVDSRIIVQQSKLALTGKTTSGEVVLNEKGYFEQAEAVSEENRTSKEIVLTTPNYNKTKMTDIKKTDSLDLFLTEYEYYTAKYNVVNVLDSLLKSYKDEEEQKEYFFENHSVTDRTTLTIPTEETKNEHELKSEEVTKSYAKKMNKINKDYNLNLTIFDENGEIAYANKYDLDLAVYKTYIEKYDVTSKENKRTVKKLVNSLLKYGFITNDEAREKIETVDDVLKLTYFQDALKSYYENAIVTKYKIALENEQEKLVNDTNTLYGEYVTLFNSQKATYENNYEAYETALENAGDSTFVVYNPTSERGSYGYIANLLIGFSAEQTARFDKKKAESKITAEDLENYRDTLLEELKVKDLRESWVYSNHGIYNEEDGVFTFDKDYCTTESLRTFNGAILGAKPYTYLDENSEEAIKYTFNSVKAGEMPFDTFYKDVFATVMGVDKNSTSGKIENVETANAISKRIDEDTLAKFRDLIYAYSTDPGSLSENYGYVYSPITSEKVGPIDGKYVPEYAAAARRLVNEGGVGSYELVATDYGYHILLCTSVILPSGDEPIDEDVFMQDLNEEGTMAYLFKEYKLKLISATQVNNITQSFINDNRANGVEFNKSAYEDLIDENDTSDPHAGHNH